MLVGFLPAAGFAQSAWITGNPVAQKVTVGGDQVVVCDIAAIRGEVTIPLDEIAGELEIIPLDSKTEALVGNVNKVLVTDNHIGIISEFSESFKLFDRKGEYVGNIGRAGGGPNEYTTISSARIVEKESRVYIYPAYGNTPQLLVFGFDGRAYPPVKLAYYSRFTGDFDVNPDGTITVAIVPADGNTPRIWVQDKSGNVIKVLAGPVKSEGQVTGFVHTGYNMGHFDPFLSVWDSAVQDTLSWYDASGKRLVPRFTVKNMQAVNNAPHECYELPQHYIIIYGSIHAFEGGRGAMMDKSCIIDKVSLLGANISAVRIRDIGMLNAGVSGFSEGYYKNTMPAFKFLDFLDMQFERGRITDPEKLKRYKALYDSISEDDNEILILARLKK